MNVKDVMTPHVLAVTPDESIFVAARLMLQKKISGLPVVDGLGNLVGIVSEGDFLRRAETGTKRQRPKWMEFFLGPGRLADEYVQISGRKVRDVMTEDVRTVTPDAPLEDVVRLMERHHIKRVPVVDGGKIVGIVTRANLLRAMASFVGEIAPSSAGRHDHTRAIHCRAGTATMGAGDQDRRHREKRGRAAFRHPYRREAAPGAARHRREHSGRQESRGPRRLDRARIRHVCRGAAGGKIAPACIRRPFGLAWRRRWLTSLGLS